MSNPRSHRDFTLQPEDANAEPLDPHKIHLRMNAVNVDRLRRVGWILSVEQSLAATPTHRHPVHELVRIRP